MTLTADPGQPLFEYACHEGNYPMRNIISAARAEEARGGGQVGGLIQELPHPITTLSEGGGRESATGHPLVLTINGKAELVVQDVAAYQALLDRIEASEGIQQGLADVKTGRTKPARQVFARLRRSTAYRVEVARRAEADPRSEYSPAGGSRTRTASSSQSMTMPRSSACCTSGGVRDNAGWRRNCVECELTFGEKEIECIG